MSCAAAARQCVSAPPVLAARLRHESDDPERCAGVYRERCAGCRVVCVLGCPWNPPMNPPVCARCPCRNSLMKSDVRRRPFSSDVGVASTRRVSVGRPRPRPATRPLAAWLCSSYLIFLYIAPGAGDLADAHARDAPTRHHPLAAQWPMPMGGLPLRGSSVPKEIKSLSCLILSYLISPPSYEVRCLWTQSSSSNSGSQQDPSNEAVGTEQHALRSRGHVGAPADTRTDLASRHHRFDTLACSATMRRARFYYNRGCPLFYHAAHHTCGCKAADTCGCNA